MRAVCRYAWRQVQGHVHNLSHQHAQAGEKKRVFALDVNDISDLRQIYHAGTLPCAECRSKHLGCSRHSFQLTRPWSIYAHWNLLKLLESMDQQALASREAAYGAILGAFVGDAAGGVLEFMGHKPTEHEVSAAMQMCGGGVWNLGPGQVTDDSEMAICLLQGLLDSHASSPSETLPLDAIASWYIKWLDSPPFDIGYTTRNALSAGRGHGEQAGLAHKLMTAAAQANTNSLSNGCLMRVAPLAVWSSKQPPDIIAAHAMAETSLTHPNLTAQVGTAAYCIAIAHLVKHPKDAQGAIAAATEWLHQHQQQHCHQPQQHEQVSNIMGLKPCATTTTSTTTGTSSTSSSILQEGQPRQVQAQDACGVVLQWLQEAQQPGPGPEVEQNMGFMRWGFVHAFRALYQQLPFTDAIRQVLLLGGDTDTNAAIVGAFMGAFWGASAIPDSMTGPVLARDVSSRGQQRPAFLHTKQLPSLFERLWEAAGR